MEDEFPLVCICVPTYNSSGTVRATLESILSQTYPNLVVHVSDNASTDDTLKVIESLADHRVTIHRNAENIGGEGNFTRCIQLATGKYAAIFHADDIYEPEMVAKQVAFLEKNLDVGAVFTSAATIDEKGRSTGFIGNPPSGIQGGVARFSFRDLLKAMLLHHNFLVCPSVMARTQVYKNEIKEWGSNLFMSASDIDTWLRLASSRPVAVLSEPLMRYRISSAQYSNKIRNRTERTDFFLVMDHYLAKPEVIDLLDKRDFRHYKWLERHECVSRSLNLIGLGRTEEAKLLLNGVFSLDSLNSAIHSRRGLVTLGGAILVRVLILLGVSKNSAAIVKTIKNISWR